MTAIWPAVPTTPTAGAPPRPAGAAARGVPDTGARRGSALTLAVLGMATVSFNMTRVGGWTISDLFFLASGAIVVIKLLNNDQRFLTPKR